MKFTIQINTFEIFYMRGWFDKTAVFWIVYRNQKLYFFIASMNMGFLSELHLKTYLNKLEETIKMQ
jgi:hypothetical protein